MFGIPILQAREEKNSEQFVWFWFLIVFLFFEFNFNSLLNSGENDDSFQFLMETNTRCQRMWRILIKCTIASMCWMFTTSTFSVIYFLKVHGTFDVNYLLHPFRITWVSNDCVCWSSVDGLHHNLVIFSDRLPWDQSTPAGYFGEVIFDVFMGHAYLFCNFTFLLLFVSICWHHQAFHKMFEHTSRKLNNHDRNRNNTEFVCSLIRYQISVREWVLCHHGIEKTHFF